MSTTQHTPGPWIVIDNLKEVDAIGIYADNGGTLICELRDPEDAADSERMLANAPLIASAPELLEALRAIQPFLQSWVDAEKKKCISGPHVEAQRLITMSQHAIAKLKGPRPLVLATRMSQRYNHIFHRRNDHEQSPL